MGHRHPVEVLGAEDVPEVVSVLAESFADYPVMRFVLGSRGDYTSRLERLITFFVLARVLRHEVMLGVRGPGGLSAAALLSDPAGGVSPPELSVVRERTWSDLGPEARARYELFGAATAPFSLASRHLHLNMIGVRHAALGQGLARAVLDRVHERSAADAVSAGVTLSTESEANVPLYEHFGYRVTGTADVGSAFTTWAMYRPDP